MIIKKSNGKEYKYDYRVITLRGDHYERLKSVAKKENSSMARLINKLIENYESNSK